MVTGMVNRRRLCQETETKRPTVAVAAAVVTQSCLIDVDTVDQTEASLGNAGFGAVSRKGQHLRMLIFFDEDWHCAAAMATQHKLGLCENAKLFDFCFGAGCFDLFLDLFSDFLGNTLSERLRSFFDKGFGFSKAEARNHCANFFNRGDFVGASVGEDDVEFGLLSNGFSRAGGTTSGGNGDRSCGANAPFVFKSFHKFSDFQDGKGAEFIYEFGKVCHNIIFQCVRWAKHRSF